MKILIANPGSTSYKCKLYDTSEMKVLFEGIVERIGDHVGKYSFSIKDGIKKSTKQEIPDYYSAINVTIQTLRENNLLNEIAAIGFKTVQAKGVSGCVELTNNVIQAMRDFRTLSPVHTDVYLTAISVFNKLLSSTLKIGLFETHFHQNIPEEAYLYGIPYDLTEKHSVRKYGFHGASHRYIGLRTKQLFSAEKVISCHLGGSSSVCAIKNGWSIDTSMGMSPQCGVLNAKRVGDLDPFALLFLMEKENLTVNDARDILMSKSGLLGISGISGDLRDIEKNLDDGNERARKAFNTFAYSVKRYIGEYMAVLNGADCIVFTAGSGQNSPKLRRRILINMENLGIILDEDRNNSNPVEGLISKDNSPVKIAIIPTDEELIVTTEIKKFIENTSTNKIYN